MKIHGIAALLLILSVAGYGQAGLAGCFAAHRGDSLVLENTVMQRVYLYNGGNLIASSVTDKRTGKIWIIESRRPAFSIPGVDAEVSQAQFNVHEVKGTRQAGAHLEAELIVAFGSLQVKRVFKIYPDCPAIACDLYLKGTAPSWLERSLLAIDPAYADSTNVLMERQANSVVIDRLSLPGRQWKVKSVEFFDMTDKNNTLVQEYPRLAYLHESWLRGNLLFMQEASTGNGLFWLKEAPVSGTQLSYPGFDFSVMIDDFKAVGIGIGPKDLSDSEWIRGYSIVTGVASGGSAGAAVALRTYQQHLRSMAGEDMIMLNTWGDRGQDKNINESFVLNELRLGSRLGITHFQMDDGWQTGKSASSAFKGGSFKNIWQNPLYWQPDPVKLPHGFDSIVAEGNRRGILISTWFNPYTDSSFKYWQKDADVLIGQYKKYGIHTWKIDGVNIPDKRAEINFRKMLDTVIARTQQETVFNLDVTAGRRFGYHYFYEYGNLFLENRYTDWVNYYPHCTLRNVWMLSRYIPPQRLQIEFLNKWRNVQRYPAQDSLTPAHYSFDYLFAITMPAQPLAWMEARNLPSVAYAVSGLIGTYKKYWKEWHAGKIFPIGDEPSGSSWTGFQSFGADDSVGFVLVFRERNPQQRARIQLHQIKPGVYAFEHLGGNGQRFQMKVTEDKIVSFELPQMLNFAFYRYRRIQ